MRCPPHPPPLTTVPCIPTSSSGVHHHYITTAVATLTNSHYYPADCAFQCISHCVYYCHVAGYITVTICQYLLRLVATLQSFLNEVVVFLQPVVFAASPFSHKYSISPSEQSSPLEDCSFFVYFSHPVSIFARIRR